MLGRYSENELDSQLDEDLGSDELQRNTNPNSEDFRSLPITNRENSETTVVTARFIK